MEEDFVVLPPYWLVIYVDDYSQKHMATIKDKDYLYFIENRYYIIEKKIIVS